MRTLYLATTVFYPPREIERTFSLFLHRLLLWLVQFLDLFSGSGSVGIEALSRGAGHATFVDFAKDCCDVRESERRRQTNKVCPPYGGGVLAVVSALVSASSFSFPTLTAFCGQRSHP